MLVCVQVVLLARSRQGCAEVSGGSVCSGCSFGQVPSGFWRLGPCSSAQCLSGNQIKRVTGMLGLKLIPTPCLPNRRPQVWLSKRSRLPLLLQPSSARRGAPLSLLIRYLTSCSLCHRRLIFQSTTGCATAKGNGPLHPFRGACRLSLM